MPNDLGFWFWFWFWMIAAFVFLISSLVAVDASKNRIPTAGGRYGYGTDASIWFFGCLFPVTIWYVLPEYFIRRSRVLRWRTQKPTWEEGTNYCEDYIVTKEKERIIVFRRARWGFLDVVAAGWIGQFACVGIALLATHVIVLGDCFLFTLGCFFCCSCRFWFLRRRLPWIFDYQEDLFLKGARPLRSLSSIKDIQIVINEYGGNVWWHVNFTPDLQVRWGKKLFKGARLDYFKFESEAHVRIFAAELAKFICLRVK
jgi:hypothetical protein